MLDGVDMEEWRDVVGYEGLYQVSNFGRVRSLERKISYGNTQYTKRAMNMKVTVGKNLYCRVTLTKDGKQSQVYVHRLVAEAFLPNPDNLPEVDHIDANPSNNNLSNLHWVSHKENMDHMIELGRNYDGSENLKHDGPKRAVVRNDGKRYDSLLAAAKDLGYKTNFVIWSNLNGKTKSCRGYTFRYA